MKRCTTRTGKIVRHVWQNERIVTGSGRTQIKSPYKVIAPQSDMPSVPRVELAREKEVRRVGKKERNDVQNARGQPTFPPIF